MVRAGTTFSARMGKRWRSGVVRSCLRPRPTRSLVPWRHCCVAPNCPGCSPAARARRHRFTRSRPRRRRIGSSPLPGRW